MKKVRVFNVLLLIISLFYFFYIFYIQCIRFRYYRDAATKEHQKKMILYGARGNIYDRNGLPIVTSQQCFSIFCTPRYTKNREHLAQELARLSQKPIGRIRGLIDDGKFFWVEMKVDLEKKEKYLDIGDPSIGWTHDLNRQYNMPQIFSDLIGKCGMDNQGLEGLELQLNDILNGKSGFIIYQKNPMGEIFPYPNYPEKEPEPGCNIYLSIDLQLQAILSEHLKDCLIREDAKSAAGLVIEPLTGEILALVNINKDNNGRNQIICDEFEPGSTFKIVTLTYALLNGVKEGDKFDTENGKLKVCGHIINDYKNYGVVTFRQAIAHSSNVAMVKVARRFNRQGFYLLIRDFGFTQPTGIELPGEVRGRLSDPLKMNEIEFSSLVFGQGITCSLLQLAFAYQTIAHKGILNKPIIVREIKDNKKVVYHAKSLKIRRVVSEDIAAKVTNILCSVVDEGSGVEAQIDGIKIAGKTGTAQKVVDGKYSNSLITTTFIGYFPANEPRYLIALMLDEPKRGMWASAITAPLFKRIAQSICQINTSQYAIK